MLTALKKIWPFNNAQPSEDKREIPHEFMGRVTGRSWKKAVHMDVGHYAVLHAHPKDPALLAILEAFLALPGAKVDTKEYGVELEGSRYMISTDDVTLDIQPETYRELADRKFPGVKINPYYFRIPNGDNAEIRVSGDVHNIAKSYVAMRDAYSQSIKANRPNNKSAAQEIIELLEQRMKEHQNPAPAPSTP